jgi:hypothetical protein
MWYWFAVAASGLLDVGPGTGGGMGVTVGFTSVVQVVTMVFPAASVALAVMMLERGNGSVGEKQFTQ